MNRAKSLRLNLRLRKVRGTIDDTRIYVDQLKFQYWAIESIASRLRELTIVSSSSLEAALPDASDEISAVEDPRVQLFHILNSAYGEFCRNKFYGVDSYIGRRIRHGTLSGVLVLELRETVEGIVCEFELIAPNYSKSIERWYRALENGVKTYRDELLWVRSDERKHGLIVPSLDDPEKRITSNSMLDAVAETLVGDRSISTAIGHIYNYCWLLLEVDLKRLRAAAEAMRQGLVIRPTDHATGNDGDLDARISASTRHLNTLVQQRFESLSNWLTRPSNISPSATLSLLFQAVVDEVQGRYSEFYPKLTEEGEVGIDIFGHRFHAIYDALFVLVDNAARYGKSGGEIKFNVVSSKLPGVNTEISMSITSELKPDSGENRRTSIEKAMSSDLGNAMLDAKDSGLRKVRTLVAETDELTQFSVSMLENSVKFQLVMQIPLTSPAPDVEDVE